LYTKNLTNKALNTKRKIIMRHIFWIIYSNCIKPVYLFIEYFSLYDLYPINLAMGLKRKKSAF
jgi:hypothetical protein